MGFGLALWPNVTTEARSCRAGLTYSEMMTGDRTAKHHRLPDSPDLALLAGFYSELPGLLLTYGSQGWVGDCGE